MLEGDLGSGGAARLGYFEDTREEQADEQALKPAGIVISTTVFLYVISIYIFGSIEGLSRFSILLATLLWILIGVRSRSTRLSVSRLQVLPWFFFGFTLLSLIWTKNLELWMLNEGPTFSAVLGGLGVWMAIRNGLSDKVIPWALLVGSMVLIVSTRGEIAFEGIEGRASGLVGNANALATHLGLSAFGIWSCPAKLPRWMHIAGWGFVAYAVLFTGSRKSLIILVIALLWTALFLFRWLKHRHKKGLWLVITVAIIVVALVADLRLSQLTENFSVIKSVSRAQQSFDWVSEERKTMIEDAINLWRRSPIIGHGAGQFAELTVYGTYSHNNYTELLANFGLIGLFLYYWLPLAILLIVLRRIHKREPRVEQAALLILLMLALDLAMVSYPGKISYLFWAMIATLASEESNAYEYSIDSEC
jgi:O-antigen ligase